MTGMFPVIVEINSRMVFHKTEDALRMAVVAQTILPNPADVKVLDASPHNATIVDGEKQMPEIIPIIKAEQDRSGWTVGRQEAEGEAQAVIKAFRRIAGLDNTVTFEPILNLDTKIKRWTVDYASMVAAAAEIPDRDTALTLAQFRDAVAEAHASIALRGISFKSFL